MFDLLTKLIEIITSLWNGIVNFLAGIMGFIQYIVVLFMGNTENFNHISALIPYQVLIISLPLLVVVFISFVLRLFSFIKSLLPFQ